MNTSRYLPPCLLTSSLAAAILTGCAAMVPSQPARLAPLVSQATAPLSVNRDVEIKLSTGYSRTVPAGSRWRAIGLLPEGVVYQRSDDVFTIEGHHVHEAYLVIKGGTLEGFYLAGESSYSPLLPPVSLTLGAP
jgi:hypothetical protein